MLDQKLQLPLNEWPTGLDLSIALVRELPNDLNRQSHIEFTDQHDELDEFQGALIQSQSGKHYALVSYKNAPDPKGTEIWVHPQEDFDLRVSLEEVMELLNLTWNSILWLHPEIPHVFERKTFQRPTVPE